jgi:hypothetical protein
MAVSCSEVLNQKTLSLRNISIKCHVIEESVVLPLFRRDYPISTFSQVTYDLSYSSQ